jgi:hypothetical protein
MALNYTFSVTQLEIAPSGSDGHPDVVTRVRYNYVGVDENGYSGSFAGATPMPQPSGSFIPFEDLTETEVAAWLDVVADKPHMQLQIQKQINNQTDPQNVPAPLPWASPSGSGSL